MQIAQQQADALLADSEAPTLPNFDPEADTLAAEPDGSEPSLAVIDILEAPPRARKRRLPHGSGAALLRPAPWALGIGGAIAFIVLAVTAPSWGSLATRDGMTLLAVGACAALLILLLRKSQQHWVRRRWPLITALVLVVGLLGVTLAPTIHTLQAHTLENQGNYQRAIDEYIASGEHSPDGQDIARCYLEWGQRDLRQQDYAAAVTHLGTATETFHTTMAASQAREPMGQALLKWGRELIEEQHYAQAIEQFARLRTHYADTTAEQAAQDNQDEPAAYYAWAQGLEANQQFQDALTQFQTIGRLFPASSYTTLAYDAAASDLYAWGQAQIQLMRYTDATATYQRLIKQYGNAPAAQQAQQDLNAPQPVKGRLLFASGPPDANVIVRLSSSWETGPNSYVQGGYVYEAHTDPNGFFTFSSVPLGNYLIDWQQGVGFTTLLHPGTYNPVYLANVESLHGTDLGDIQVDS